MNDDIKAMSLNMIEDLGLFLEKSGYLPSAARVYALLMIWDVSELHFDEIQEILNLSKGATSKALNALQQMNRVEMFTKNGIRKKFYRVRVTPGKDSALGFIKYLSTMREHLNKVEAFKVENNIAGVRFEDEIKYFDKLIELFKHVTDEF